MSDITIAELAKEQAAAIVASKGRVSPVLIAEGISAWHNLSKADRLESAAHTRIAASNYAWQRHLSPEQLTAMRSMLERTPHGQKAAALRDFRIAAGL
jgi:hypothetical protein